MDLKEKIEVFGRYGVGLNKIAEQANMARTTLNRYIQGVGVAVETPQRINDALKSIAMELYNTAFAEENEAAEEWEE